MEEQKKEKSKTRNKNICNNSCISLLYTINGILAYRPKK